MVNITPAVHPEDLDERHTCGTHAGSLRDGPTCARRHRELGFLVVAGGYVALEKRKHCGYDELWLEQQWQGRRLHER